MDAVRFDRLTVAVAGRTARRTALALLSSLGLSGLLMEDAQAVCENNGSHCQRSDDCCSGRCKRKRGTGKKFCRAAPGQGICTIESDDCASTTTSCGSGASGGSHCFCYRRTSGASVCARFDATNKCNFSGECTAAKCRAAFAAYPNGKKAFCGECGICGVTQSGICLLPCDDPDPA